MTAEALTPEMLKSLAINFGIAGLALVITYRALGLVQFLVLAKKGVAPAIPCQSDPNYAHRAMEMHAHTEALHLALEKGELKCAWKGRDEIRDLMESIRELTAEMRRNRTNLDSPRNPS